MKADDIRFLFAYDRWATRRILAALDGLDTEVWSRANVIDERGLGGILVHQLGAAQRWRIMFETQGDGEGPRPERGAIAGNRRDRRALGREWAAVDAWLATLTDDFLQIVFEGVPIWQMMVHVVNHGTQHRSEAAALLTAEGHSPGDLDVIDYSNELAGRSNS